VAEGPIETEIEHNAQILDPRTKLKEVGDLTDIILNLFQTHPGFETFADGKLDCHQSNER